MLAKDVFALNDLDGKIQELIEQLNDLIERRIEITSETCPLSRKLMQSRTGTVDLSSIDLTIDPACGLSIKSDQQQ